MSNGSGYGQSYGNGGVNGGSQGGGGGQGAPDTKMLMQQIQQLQKTVMQLQARDSGPPGVADYSYSTGGGAAGNGPASWYGSAAAAGYGYGTGSGYGSGSGYGPNSGFGGGYSTGWGEGPTRAAGGGGGGAGGPKRSNLRENKDGEDVTSDDQVVVLVSNIPPELSHPDALYSQFEKFGDVERIKILHNKRNTALIQFADSQGAKRSVTEQAVLNSNGSEIFVSYSSRFKEVKIPQPGSIHDDGLTKDYTGQHPELMQMPKNQRAQNQYGGMMETMYGGGMGGYGGMMGGMRGGPPSILGNPMGMPMGGEGMDMGRGSNSVVLLVSNIPDQVATCDMIFNMLGAYGDVVCVKILRNKRDCALVQMAKPHHAQQVRNNLDQAKIGGNKLCISNSRVDNLLNKKLMEDEGLQKDFSNSRQHRFRNQNQAVKIQRNLGPPTSVLHVANIPDGYTHIDIKDMFIDRGFTVKESKDCEGKSHMCYLIFAGPDEALMALAAMHNYAPDELKFKNSNGLCVSFSKAVKKD